MTHDACSRALGSPGVLRTLLKLRVADLAADFDDNGVVNLTDFFLFADAFGQMPEGALVRFDLDHNGAIDFNDFFIFVDSFGKTVDDIVPPPEEFPIVLATRSFFDPALENIEPDPGIYGFDFPVKADILLTLPPIRPFIIPK